jgi:ribonucleoside-diphosphate reductase alpha chain
MDGETMPAPIQPPAEVWPPIAQNIWDMKYRLKDAAGVPIDRTVADSWRRVAAALAAPEREPERWEPVFYEALEGFRFLPGGRVIAGAGSGRDVTLFNCFVMGRIADDMGSIFAHLREAALTMQQGGGIGYDFSTLRPQGAPVKGVGADASGPLSFMDVWDAMCRTIMSAGYRRGAMMATLACDHPDIEAFIEAKQEPGRLRMFNLSVLVTDAFMDAVAADSEWPLVFGGELFKTVRAAALWDKIMRATYAYAEPGVIFIDRVNRANNLHYCEDIRATNPCFTGDTLFLTDRGYRRLDAGAAAGTPVSVWDGEKFVDGVTPRLTGKNQRLLRVSLSNGVELHCTPYHLFETHDGRTIEAHALEVGERLAKYRMPVIWIGTDHSDAYTQGLFAADGYVLHADRASRSAAIDLYGPKRALLARLVGVQRVHESEATPDRLSVYLGPGAVDLDKAMVPDCSWSVESRLEWLAGLCDGDGVAVREPASVGIQITSVDREFLLAVRLMLTTLGVADAAVGALKPAGRKLMPDGRGAYREYDVQDSWRLIINASRVAQLQSLGFRTSRLTIEPNDPARDASRFIAVVAVIDEGQIADRVYCFANPASGRGCFDGIITRQCGEQPLPPYGACLLGSLNLAALVEDPFTPGARIPAQALRRLTRTAIRMLDNVVDVSRFPLEQQRAEAVAKRRVGLGVTGLADALIFCGQRYGSAEAVARSEAWLGAIRDAAYGVSAELAVAKGTFPLFDRDKYLAGEFVQGLEPQLRAAIALHGMRNSHLLSIAPTGTISLLGGNVSSGVEPIFSLAPYARKVLLPDGSRQETEVADFAYAAWRARFGERELPEYFVDAQSLSPEDHLVMMAAAQRHVDAAISKTINCPADIPFDAFAHVYRRAWELGCKSCTTYRPNEVTGSVLAVKPPASPAETPAVASDRDTDDKAVATPQIAEDGVVRLQPTLSSPDEVAGRRYRIRWPDSDHALYAILTDIEEHGRLRPWELFLVSNEAESDEWRVALGRMISAVFKKGGDVAFVAKELQAIFDKKGGAWLGGKRVASLPAAIGAVIERHMRLTGFLPPEEGERGREIAEMHAAVAAQGGLAEMLPTHRARHRQCPKCGEPALIRSENCDRCTQCDYSKC